MRGHSVTLAVRSFHQSDRLASCFRSKFDYQYSTDDISSQGQGSERFVLYRKTLGHFFRNEQIFKEGTYKFL